MANRSEAALRKLPRYFEYGFGRAWNFNTSIHNEVFFPKKTISYQYCGNVRFRRGGGRLLTPPPLLHIMPTDASCLSDIYTPARYSRPHNLEYKTG